MNNKDNVYRSLVPIRHWNDEGLSLTSLLRPKHSFKSVVAFAAMGNVEKKLELTPFVALFASLGCGLAVAGVVLVGEALRSSKKKMKKSAPTIVVVQ